MARIRRRDVLKTAAALAAGGAAGSGAMNVQAQAPRTPFAVAQTSDRS